MKTRRASAGGIALLGFALFASSALAGACSATLNTSPLDGGSSGGNGSDGSSAQGDGSTTNSGGLPCDVSAVLTKNCQTCHASTPLFGAPMPLVTYADLQASITDTQTNAKSPAFQVVEKRIHDDNAPMPQPPNPRLNAADTATIDNWVAAGAPAGTTTTCSTTGDDGGTVTPLGCTPTISTLSTSAWNMPQADTDDYVCYGFDVTGPASNESVTAIQAHVDNTKIVHHMLLFQATSSVSGTPAVCSAGGNVDWRIVSVWAPGGNPVILPSNVGFPLNAGVTTHYVVQVHYNNINGLSGQTDQSGFAMCTDAQRQYDADVLAFGTQNIKIPPHGTLDETCTLTVPSQVAGKTMLTSMPHMHKLGSLIDTTITHAGVTTPLETVSNWNFQNQAWYPINITAQTGDVVSVRCAWNNPTDAEVDFGQNTENEMCYSFAVYYPAITSGLWNWQVPSLGSACSPTP